MAKSLSSPSHNSLLPHLDGLLTAPTLLKDFSYTSIRYQDLVPVLNTASNTLPPGINMIPDKVYMR